MSMSEQLDQLATALSAFQGEVTDARKDVSGYNYKYADLSQVLDIARPLMAKHGLSLAQFPGSAGDKVTIESYLLHKSGQFISGTIEMPVTLNKGMTHAQCVGSVITYARRYATGAILGITQTDNDAAGEEAKHDNFEKTSPKIDEKQLKHLLQVAPADRLNAYMNANNISRYEDFNVSQYDSIIYTLRAQSAEKKVA